MVAGLFVPTIGAYFWKRSSSTAAIISMLIGGGSTLYLIFSDIEIIYGFDPSIVGIFLSAIAFIGVSFIRSRN
jgi:SSS family solute:Na+ symporter